MRETIILSSRTIEKGKNPGFFISFHITRFLLYVTELNCIFVPDLLSSFEHSTWKSEVMNNRLLLKRERKKYESRRKNQTTRKLVEEFSQHMHSKIVAKIVGAKNLTQSPRKCTWTVKFPRFQTGKNYIVLLKYFWSWAIFQVKERAKKEINPVEQNAMIFMQHFNLMIFMPFFPLFSTPVCICQMWAFHVSYIHISKHHIFNFSCCRF